jgi:intracellular septation protein
MDEPLPASRRGGGPDIAVIFGFVWAALMFASAALNLIVTLNSNVVTWFAFMSIYSIVSKAALFLITYATLRLIGVRRRRAKMALTQMAQP